MLRKAQAQRGAGAYPEARFARARPARLAVLAAALACLTACGGGGGVLRQAEVDRGLYTSSTPAVTRTAAESGLALDEATIRNAVSSADLENPDAAVLAWANADTAARGVISGIAERREGTALCRSFQTTRESFDGVRAYRGTACRVSEGLWRMEPLQPL